MMSAINWARAAMKRRASAAGTLLLCDLMISRTCSPRRVVPGSRTTKTGPVQTLETSAEQFYLRGFASAFATLEGYEGCFLNRPARH